MLGSNQFDQFNLRCASLDTKDFLITDVWTQKGVQWIETSMGNSLYNHNLTPNQNSCFNGSMVREGSLTASSYHNSSINALFADGHVVPIKESVESTIWRSLSTKSGGEITPSLD